MMRYRELGNVGGEGIFAQSLRAITLDEQDRLYAAGDSMVRVFDAASKPIGEWPTARPGFSVAVAGDGSVWVGQEGQIEIFDAAGKPRDTWRDPERLGRVTAIGFVQDCVLAGDARDRAIRRYNNSGKFLNDIGKNNRRRGFLIPNGIIDFSVDSGGVIHATNPGKHRVERYTPEDKLLGHIGRFGGLDPAGFSGCCNPTNVTVTGRDRIYCTEKADPRAKVYDFDGNLLAVIAEDVFHPGSKNMDIAVDSRGRVYVAETVKRTIFVFSPEAAA
ncbi:MAG: hypothetical protein GY953_31045 [bacterium]|nr:hypothetical protein [bacterium]